MSVSSSSSSTVDDFEIFQKEFQKFSEYRPLAELVKSYLAPVDDFEVFKKEFQKFSEYRPLADLVESYLAPPQVSTAKESTPEKIKSKERTPEEIKAEEDSIPFMPGIIILNHLTEGRHGLAARYPNPTFSYLQFLRNLAIRLFCQNFDVSEMGRDESLKMEKLAIQALCGDEVLKSCTWRSGFVALNAMTERFSSHSIINVQKFNSVRFAVFSKDSEIAKFMISSYPSAINLCEEGFGPLLHWSINKNPEVVKLLVDAKADVNFRFNKFSPLTLAGKGGSLKAVQILIAGGANIEQIDNDDTPLAAVSWAVRSPSQVKIMAELIQAGAVVNRIGCGGRTALMTVLDRRQVAAAELLLSKSDVSILNPENGQSALFYAARDCSSMVVPLIKRKADVHVCDDHKRTALFYAISSQKDDAVTSLLQAKADPYAKDDNGKSGLDYICDRSKERMEALIQSCQSSS